MFSVTSHRIGLYTPLQLKCNPSRLLRGKELFSASRLKLLLYMQEGPESFALLAATRGLLLRFLNYPSTRLLSG